MKFEVNLELIDSFENKTDKHDGIITVYMLYENGPEIRWIISDCGCFPSSDWINFLKYMKGLTSTSSSISGGGNSSWDICVEESMCILTFDIGGSGGDSNIKLKFSIPEMIPVIEEIINALKRIELN